ncbi:unnamed protein product [Ectocarpus sp. CCAP 1310/34]|nr:unnamed protein product [Ectocarpus sp. CCAP 1310/34]
MRSDNNCEYPKPGATNLLPPSFISLFLHNNGRLHRQVVSCEPGCGETLLERDAKAHAAYRRVLRVVTCWMAACGKRMPAKGVSRHLDEDCVAHRAWMRMAEAGHELQESCTCPHCGETVRRSQLTLHFQYQCHWFKEQRRKAGCGAWVPRQCRAEQ